MIPRRHLIMMLLLVVAAGAVSIAFYDRLPAQAPTHWNIRGEADDWSDRWKLAVAGPGFGLGLTMLLTGLPLLGPFRRNFERFRTTYGRICVTSMTALAAIHTVAVVKATGYPLEIGATLSIVVGLLLAVIGNWLGKVRRNFYIGIRTPWTIANDVVWEKTHRVGSKLMVLVGLVAAAAGFVAPSWLCFVILVGGVLLLFVWAMAYSLYWYRRLGAEDELAPASDA